MDLLMGPVEAVRDFMELGGDVLTLIALTIFVMWVLIIERMIYFRTGLKTMGKEIYDTWEARPERRSWNAHQIRDAMISRFAMAANVCATTMYSLLSFRTMATRRAGACSGKIMHSRTATTSRSTSHLRKLSRAWPKRWWFVAPRGAKWPGDGIR